MPDHVELKPVPGCSSFLFRRCLVEQRGSTLTITVPSAGLSWRGARIGADGKVAWSAAAPLPPAALAISCAGGPHRRYDSSEYPGLARYAEGTQLSFTGGLSFGRALAGEGAALLVQTSVQGIAGLPAGTSWSGYDLIELDNRAPAASPKPAAGGAASAAAPTAVGAASAAATTAGGGASAAAPAGGGDEAASGGTTGPHLPYP